MPVISSEIIRAAPQAEGKVKVRLRLTFHNGETRTPVMLLTEGYDEQAILLSAVANAEKAAKSAELSKMADVVAYSGMTVEQIIASLQHNTLGEALAEVIRWGVEGDDPRHLANMEPVFNYVEAAFTDAEIVAMTGVTQNRVDTYRARMQAITSVAKVSDSLKAVDQMRGSLDG